MSRSRQEQSFQPNSPITSSIRNDSPLYSNEISGTNTLDILYSILNPLVNGVRSSQKSLSVQDFMLREDHSNTVSESNELCALVNKSMIGKNYEFEGPFGMRKILYADFIASGRSLSFIEDYIREHVLPEYANTHTTTSITGLQTSLYRLEAKGIVRNAVRAGDDDAVIFVGSGSTGAIAKLIHSMSLENKPVVIVGPFEHHSNLLPWRHISERWYRIGLTKDGTVCLANLEELLQQEYELCKKENRKILVCMNSASNITGILTDVDAVSAIVHAYDAFVFFDYATAAPYVKIDMNPVWTEQTDTKNYKSKRIHKDAVFFSAHKFVGGPQSSGVLIVKKSLLSASQAFPETPAGGTVFLVTRGTQFYLTDIEHREEGGTPAIVEDIRTGIVLKLKETIGVDTILTREFSYLNKAWSYLNYVGSLHILGSRNAPRLPVLSFVVSFDEWPSTDQAARRKLLLHHNFISALLNDLFGIQCRGGCACAGPYAMDLLGIDEELALRLGRAILGNKIEEKLLNPYFEVSSLEVLRPGFVRFSLPYFMSSKEVQFILDAIKFVCRNGWVFLPLYKVDFKTGSYTHQNWDPMKGRKWLQNISFSQAQPAKSPLVTDSKRQSSAPATYNDCLMEAHRLLEQTKSLILTGGLDAVDITGVLPQELQEMRWFLLSCEVVAVIRNTTSALAYRQPVLAPFWPVSDGLASQYSETHNGIYEPLTSEQFTFQSLDENLCSHSVFSEPSSLAWDRNEITPEPIKEENVLANFSNNNKTVIAKQVRALNKQLKSKTKVSLNHKMEKWKIALKKAQKLEAISWINPLPDLFKQFLQGVKHFNMLQPGDRALVCLSGGKDSLSLLHCLHQYQAVLRNEHAKANNISQEQVKELLKTEPHFGTFELGAVTIDPGSESYDPSPLISYMAKLGVPYFYEKQGIIRQASELPYECTSICSFCSRMKRGRIYSTARKAGYNVLAMGQHLDDIVESFLMAAFHQGALNTMKANYLVRTQDLRVIRPLVFAREYQTRTFAQMANLPVIPENCPACFSAPKERARMKRLLAEQETLFPRLYDNLKNALMPLLGNDKALGLNAQQNAAYAMSNLISNLDLNSTAKSPVSFSLSDEENDEQ